jgi:hypothetical protein
MSGRIDIIASDAGLSPPAPRIDMLPDKPVTRSFPVGSALLAGTATFGVDVQLFRGFETCSDTVGLRECLHLMHDMRI